MSSLPARKDDFWIEGDCAYTLYKALSAPNLQRLAVMERVRVQLAQVPALPVRDLVIRYGVYVSLALLLLIALFVTPELYSHKMMFVVFRQAAQLGIVAIGQTMVLLVAGLDLSVGGVIVLTSVIIAEVSGGQNDKLPIALLVALFFGAAIGLGNSLLVTKRNVPPFVATLGMLVFIRGAQTAYTKGIPSGYVPNALSVVNNEVGPVPVPVLIWLGLNAVLAFVLYATPYGRRVYSVGSNREAARLSGINVDRVLISVYILCSLLAVAAGIVLTGYIGYVDRYLGRGLDLDSIAAAVVGGTAFTGGRGSLLGTVAGVLLVQVLSSMTVLLGMSVQSQLVIKGIVIVGAVALYSVASRR
jgi:ribose/xylose/arabinose/galactoside ABC-type transport system permease subunit